MIWNWCLLQKECLKLVAYHHETSWKNSLKHKCFCGQLKFILALWFMGCNWVDAQYREFPIKTLLVRAEILWALITITSRPVKNSGNTISNNSHEDYLKPEKKKRRLECQTIFTVITDHYSSQNSYDGICQQKLWVESWLEWQSTIFWLISKKTKIPPTIFWKKYYFVFIFEEHFLSQ